MKKILLIPILMLGFTGCEVTKNNCNSCDDDNHVVYVDRNVTQYVDRNNTEYVDRPIYIEHNITHYIERPVYIDHNVTVYVDRNITVPICDTDAITIDSNNTTGLTTFSCNNDIIKIIDTPIKTEQVCSSDDINVTLDNNNGTTIFKCNDEIIDTIKTPVKIKQVCYGSDIDVENNTTSGLTTFSCNNNIITTITTPIKTEQICTSDDINVSVDNDKNTTTFICNDNIIKTIQTPIKFVDVVREVNITKECPVQSFTEQNGTIKVTDCNGDVVTTVDPIINESVVLVDHNISVSCPMHKLQVYFDFIDNDWHVDLPNEVAIVHDYLTNHPDALNRSVFEVELTDDDGNIILHAFTDLYGAIEAPICSGHYSLYSRNTQDDTTEFGYTDDDYIEIYDDEEISYIRFN